MSGVRGALDIQRIISMVRSPGIDTRTWIAFAEVTGVRIVRGDADAGIFVDLVIFPFGEEYTGQLLSMHVANNAGLYIPLAIGETVIVSFPYGDPAVGVTVLGRFFAGDAMPPEESIVNGEPSPDVLWIMEDDQHWRVITQGEGNIVLEPRGTGKVGIGGEPGSADMEPIALGDKTNDALGEIKSWVSGELANIKISLDSVPAPTPYIPGIAPILPNVNAEKGEVK